MKINKKINKLDRQFLHAKILGFNHPKSKKNFFWVKFTKRFEKNNQCARKI